MQTDEAGFKKLVFIAKTHYNKFMGTRTKILVFAVVAFTSAAIAFCLPFVWLEDATIDTLLRGTLFRLCAGGAGVCLLFICGYQSILKFKITLKEFLWCLPCFAVALANFPYGALISGGAYIDRAELIPLLIVYCVSVAVFEEAVFRGILLLSLKNLFKQKKRGGLYAVLISSAAFGLWHLLNLFGGAGVGETFLQVGYTFLLGAMLAAAELKTHSLWLCVIIHAIFDFGGFIVPYLGFGAAQDISFWTLTAVAGAGCLIHVLYFLLNNKN